MFPSLFLVDAAQFSTHFQYILEVLAIVPCPQSSWVVESRTSVWPRNTCWFVTDTRTSLDPLAVGKMLNQLGLSHCFVNSLAVCMKHVQGCSQELQVLQNHLDHMFLAMQARAFDGTIREEEDIHHWFITGSSLVHRHSSLTTIHSSVCFTSSEK